MAAFANYPILNEKFTQIANMGKMPKEGPRCIPLTQLDFTAQAGYSMDLTQVQRQDRLTIVQTIFVDNSGNPGAVTITFGGTGQVIVANPNTQGYYPVMCTSPITLTVSMQGAPSPGLPTSVPIYLINIPIEAAQWPA
jgi:hypothetical protein